MKCELEQIEEILIEASTYARRLEVINRAEAYQNQNLGMSRIETYEEAFKRLVTENLER